MLHFIFLIISYLHYYSVDTDFIKWDADFGAVFLPECKIIPLSVSLISSLISIAVILTVLLEIPVK